MVRLVDQIVYIIKILIKMEIVIRCRKNTNPSQKQNQHRQNEASSLLNPTTKHPILQKFPLPNFLKQRYLNMQKQEISSAPVEVRSQSKSYHQASNSVVFIRLYSKQLGEEGSKIQKLGFFLQRHHIDAVLRARMLDWMTEVNNSYRFDAKTYFDGAQMLDRYLGAEKAAVEASQLHALGVAAMLLASKSNQVRPLRITTAYQKIGHRKIPMNRLSLAQAEIMTALEYKLNQWTFYDVAAVILAPYQLPNALSILAYIGRVTIIEYNFYAVVSPLLLGKAAAWVTMRVLGKEMRGSEEVVGCGQEIVKFLRNFKDSYPGMRNAIRFTEKRVLESISHYLDNN